MRPPHPVMDAPVDAVNSRRSYMKKWITLAAALCLALSVFDRVMAHSSQQPQRGDEVRVVPNGQRAGSTPGQKGATYYALEGQSTRVTTTFTDGSVAEA